MKLKIAIPLSYMILIGMFFLFIASFFISLWKNNPRILILTESIQSLLALGLFAIIARATTLS